MQYSFCNYGPALLWFFFYETQWRGSLRSHLGGVSFVELVFSNSSHCLVSRPLLDKQLEGILTAKTVAIPYIP